MTTYTCNDHPGNPLPAGTEGVGCYACKLKKRLMLVERYGGGDGNYGNFLWFPTWFLTPLPVAVTAGEMFDRYTILKVKSKFVTDAAKQAQVGHDLAAMSNYLFTGPNEIGRVSPNQHGQLAIAAPQLWQLVDDLCGIHQRLWVIEDEIRALDSQVFPLEQYGHMDCLPEHLERYLKLARSVYITNDLRSRRKNQINELVGHDPEVKQYAEY